MMKMMVGGVEGRYFASVLIRPYFGRMGGAEDVETYPTVVF